MEERPSREKGRGCSQDCSFKQPRELRLVDVHVFYCLISLALFSRVALYTQTHLLMRVCTQN